MVRQLLTRLTPACHGTRSVRGSNRAPPPPSPHWKRISGGTRMDAAYAWIVCAWIALHVAALIAAYFTRVAAGSRHENLSQLVCFAAMAIIGIAVWISQET